MKSSSTLVRCAVAVMCISAHPVLAADPPTDRLLVLDLTAFGIDVNTARSLSEILASTIRETSSSIVVLGQSEINSMLALEKQRDLLGCSDDVSCLAEIGGALGADHLTVGSIGRVGTIYTISLKLLDAKHATTVRHVSKEVAADETLLIEAIRQWGAHLVHPERTAGFGYLTVRGEGEILVHGVAKGKAPLDRLPVIPGVHTVTWSSPNEEQQRREVRVPAYAVVETSPLEPGAAAPRDSAFAPWQRHKLRISGHGGMLFPMSSPGHQLGTTLKAAGRQGVGGRFGYLFDFGLEPFAGLDVRTVAFPEADGSVTFTQWAIGLGVAYSTAGRFRVVPSFALELVYGHVSSGANTSYSENVRDALADGEDAAFRLGWHWGLDLLFGIWPALDVGLRLSSQSYPDDLKGLVTVCGSLVIEGGF